MLDRIHKHAQKRLNFRGHPDKKTRLEMYQRFLKLEHEMMHRRHRAGESGLRIVRLRAAVIDTLLEHLFKTAIDDYESSGGKCPFPVCMTAVGGYGRAELSPLSDIDFMFLFPAEAKGDKVKAFQQYLTDEILYPLWDLNLKVGHSTRTITEAVDGARTDIRTRTALLDCRLIAGSENLFEIFQHAYKNFYRKENPGAFLKIRLEDQAKRRTRYGDSVFVQEPDIKNGVGGLRDYQNTLWMARTKLGIGRVEDLCEHHYLRKNEQKDFRRAYDFLLRVRNDLHFTLNRPSDLLDLEKQPVIAHHLGYEQKNIFERVEEFMRDYYRHAQNIFRYSKLLEKRLALRPVFGDTNKVRFREVIAARKRERQKKIDGFVLRGSELTFETPNVFKEDRGRLIRVFRHCQRLKCTPDFELESLIQESLRLITKNVINSPRANASFRSILQEPGMVYPILNQMHELGVLGRFVPEFGRLTCLVQHEYYHRYTADVHTLNTIRELDDIFIVKEPIMEKYREVLHELANPTLLYLILLLHDTGKAFGISGHAESGAESAPTVLARLQVPEKYWDIVTSIIQNHLLMGRFWQKHDIDDPATVATFTERVENLEKLGFLYVHTFCDARGTAGGLWNSYKDMLHTTLYKATFEQLAYGDRLTLENAKKKEMTLNEIKEKKIPGITNEEIDAHYTQLPERYFLHTDVDDIVLHLKMIHELFATIAGAPSTGSLVPIIDWKDDIDRSMTTVNVVTWDRAGLFSKLAGAFAQAGLNILTAKAISRADHIAIDTFVVIEPAHGAVESESSKTTFEKALKEALVSEKDLLPEIEAEAEKHQIPPWGHEEQFLRAPIRQRVKVYHDLSLDRTVVEVQVNDRIGLLYQLSRIIFNHGYTIVFARVATERGVAIDTIYVEQRTDLKGEKNNEPDLVKLQEDLASLIAPEPDASPDDYKISPGGPTSV